MNRFLTLLGTLLSAFASMSAAYHPADTLLVSFTVATKGEAPVQAAHRSREPRSKDNPSAGLPAFQVAGLDLAASTLTKPSPFALP